jgi:TatD DNase family protein
MTELFDTHSHIQLDAFDDDRSEAIERATASGVAHIAVCGDDPPTCEAALELASRHTAVVATVGFHPHEAAKIEPKHMEALEAWTRDSRCRAVGEIGLDYYRDRSPRVVQAAILEQQLDLAAQRGLPVLIHSRGAEKEIATPLKAYAKRSRLPARGREVGIMHCFGGTLDQAQRYVDMGFLVSLACTVTYPKNAEARRIAAGLPLGKLVVETDAPFLPPQDRRGERNEPAFVSAAAHAIASVRGVSFEEVASATTDNARRLFDIQGGNGTVPA